MRMALLVAVFLVTGCSMPTIPMFGKVQDERVSGAIFRIALPPVDHARCASASECTLLAAAEATRMAGGTHFMVMAADVATQSKNAGGAYIKVLTLDVSESPPTGAVSVEEALMFLRKREQDAS